MKRLLNLILLAIVFSFSLTAQTLDEVTKSYNEAVTGANEKPAETLTTLMALLPKAEALGEEASEITGKITGMLPTLQYNTARMAHDKKDMDGAITGFEKTVALSEKYDNPEMAKQVNDQLPMLYYTQGSAKLKAKDRAGAMTAFNKAIAMDVNYSRAYYGISKGFRGQSMDSVLYYTDKAVELAGADSKEAAGYKKGARITTSKEAAKMAKAGKNLDALAMYEKALMYTSASDEKNLSKYNYKIAKIYQGMGKTSSACSAYRKVKDAKYAESAKYEMKEKLKCN